MKKIFRQKDSGLKNNHKLLILQLSINLQTSEAELQLVKSITLTPFHSVGNLLSSKMGVEYISQDSLALPWPFPPIVELQPWTETYVGLYVTNPGQNSP